MRGRDALATAGETPAIPVEIDAIREFCLSLPHTTEQVQWGGMLVFKIAGKKMFCLLNLEPERDDTLVFFKASDEEFLALQENEGVIPAPYMARAKWLALERWDALPAPELKRLLQKSYELVFAKLPKKTQAQLVSRSKAGPSRAKARSG